MDGLDEDKIHPVKGIVHRDFKGAEALMNAEALLLIDSASQLLDESQKEMVNKTSEYLEQYMKYGTGEQGVEDVKAVREKLEAKGFTQHEVAMLANMCFESTDEAKALLPSLKGQFPDGEDDEELQSILDEIKLMRADML